MKKLRWQHSKNGDFIPVTLKVKFLITKKLMTEYNEDVTSLIARTCGEGTVRGVQNKIHEIHDEVIKNG